MRYLVVGLLVTALSGCVTNQPVNWVRAWPGNAEIYKDRAQCEYEVTGIVQFSTPGVARGVRSPIGQGIVEGFDIALRRADLFTRCMRAKGWRQGAPGESSVALVTQGNGDPPPTVTIQPISQAVPPQGKFSLQAERAAAPSCKISAMARLITSGPGFETYSVPCADGDAATIRCDFGNCRALK